MADQMSTLNGTRADTVRPQPSPERDSASRLFFDRLAVVSRYRHLIVVTVLLAIVGALLKTFTTLSLYRAHATVLLEETTASADVFRSSPRRYYAGPRAVYGNAGTGCCRAGSSPSAWSSGSTWPRRRSSMARGRSRPSCRPPSCRFNER